MAPDARNVADLVRIAAGRAADKAALVTATRSLSWTELDGLVDAAAAGLLARGLGRGDRVGVLLPNSIEFAVAYFAILRAGLVVVPLNTAYTPPELAHQLEDAGSTLVITDDAHASLVDTTTLLVGSADWETLLTTAAGVPDDVGSEDLAVLLYTSGTSGRPKGAML